jgi:hypothetical protein
MSETTIEKSVLTSAALALFDEAYRGPPSPNETWFADNEPDAGFLGVLGSIGAARASEPLTPGDPATLASHAGHLRFSLSLANRSAKGENAFAGADWKGSWAVRGVDEKAWAELVAALRKEYEDFRAVIASGGAWADETFLTGTLAIIAHGAWHLGAIRQGLGLVRSPKG